MLNEAITQSLAGRVAFLDLLPFSYAELIESEFKKKTEGFDMKDWLFTGFYPPIYDGEVLPTDWMPQYIRTYIERDVRQLKNITNLLLFEKFVRLCAGRTGQELNFTSLSVETGVDVKTIQSWIGVLVSSYIVFLLPPFYKNFNKTLVKRPKLYFYDTGLACALLGIKKSTHLNSHPLMGALFETMIVSEFQKFRANAGLLNKYYYWRDKTGREIDMIIDYGNSAVPVEIKMSNTYQKSFTKNVKYWLSLSGEKRGAVIYNGELKMNMSEGVTVLPWKNFEEVLV